MLVDEVVLVLVEVVVLLVVVLVVDVLVVLVVVVVGTGQAVLLTHGIIDEISCDVAPLLSEVPTNPLLAHIAATFLEIVNV